MKIDKLNIDSLAQTRLLKKTSGNNDLHNVESTESSREVKDSFQLQKKVSGEELVLEKTELALSRINRAKEQKLTAIRERLKSGFYLSDEVTEKISSEILDDQFTNLIDQ